MKKKQDREKHYWSPQLGNIKHIPQSKTEWDFGARDIFRILFALIFFTIPFIYWVDRIYGVIIGVVLTIVFEVSGFKQHIGLLELKDTKEFLPLWSTGFWGKLHKFLGYALAFLFFASIIIFLTWFGIV